MPQSHDRKNFIINWNTADINDIHELIELSKPEIRKYGMAAIEFSKKVRESAAWMDSGGYLHAVPKEPGDKKCLT